MKLTFTIMFQNINFPCIAENVSRTMWNDIKIDIFYKVYPVSHSKQKKKQYPNFRSFSGDLRSTKVQKKFHGLNKIFSELYKIICKNI